MNPPNDPVGYALLNYDRYVPEVDRLGDSYLTHIIDGLCGALAMHGIPCRPLNLWEPSGRQTLGRMSVQPPRFVLTLNLLPQTTLPSGARLLDAIPAPAVVNVLLDHPAHIVENMLVHRRYREFRYGVMDPLHVPFLERMGIPSSHVFFLPQAGPDCAEAPLPFSDRDIDVLFAGSVAEIEPPAEFIARHAGGDPQIGQVLLAAVDRVLEDRDEDVFAAVVAAFIAAGICEEVPLQRFAALVRAADTRARALRRCRLLESLAGLEIHFIGDFAESFQRTNPKGRYLGTMGFSQALDLMRRARVVVNDTINLKNAALIRFFYAIANGGLVASEGNPFIESEFGGAGSVIILDAKAKTNREAVTTCLADSRRWQRRVEAALAVQQARHTWRHRALALAAVLR